MSFTYRNHYIISCSYFYTFNEVTGNIINFYKFYHGSGTINNIQITILASYRELFGSKCTQATA